MLSVYGFHYTMLSEEFFNVDGVKVFLVYYCKVLTMSYINDQRKLLFIKKIRTCDNSVIRSFSAMCTHEYGKILSKYSIHNLCSGVGELKRSLGRHFVDRAIFS